MIIQDLIFTPIQVPCHNCFNLVLVSIEGLDDNEDVTCPKCNFIFTPSLEVSKFLKLIKVIENGCSHPNHLK